MNVAPASCAPTTWARSSARATGALILSWSTFDMHKPTCVSYHPTRRRFVTCMGVHQRHERQRRERRRHGWLRIPRLGRIRHWGKHQWYTPGAVLRTIRNTLLECCARHCSALARRLKMRYVPPSSRKAIWKTRRIMSSNLRRLIPSSMAMPAHCLSDTTAMTAAADFETLVPTKNIVTTADVMLADAGYPSRQPLRRKADG
mmetsp:Transcript_20770/g.52952  ORF Transcript_20770/g.52952 Transcript_20770/m.52952 type:complete len:202 (-) Transcript_20770:241-846(-)